MKDRAITIALSVPETRRKNVLREYLQAHILYSIQQSGVFSHIAFQGGTALRFLYSLKRFSEDLDFALENREGFDFHKMKGKILKDLQNSGFQAAAIEKKEKIVKVLSVRVPGVLFETGLSHQDNENLNIHVDIDTNPPLGANFATTIVDRHFVLSLRHHDLASSMAGKLHAVFSRPYVKGRDLYDLIWYLAKSEKTEPNLLFLNNALKQTKWQGNTMTPENWKQEVLRHISKFNWKNIIHDVLPFLELPQEAHILSLETFQSLLR